MHTKSFTFVGYKINKKRSTINFIYKIKPKFGPSVTFTDKLLLKGISQKSWDAIPDKVLKPTMESLLIMLGINYWCAFPTKNIKIERFKLTRAQANFWNELYLNGLGEFFYDMKMDFRGLIDFPFDDNFSTPPAEKISLKNRALLLNGAGKDSILSAEILKSKGVAFDFFAFEPTPAHYRIAKLVGANTICVNRRRDPWLNIFMAFFSISTSYPSVSTFTFVAVLLAEILGYNSIVFSNERSADAGNLNYLGLEVNHQWCKSSIAEKMTNDYIQKYITPDISTISLLRKYSELEIVKQFSQPLKYLHDVTSCNIYFWLTPIEQSLARKNYWCKRCPKCVFLFASFSAFLPKKELINMFGANLYEEKTLLPLFRRILGVEGFKPLDCVGEPEEMILAIHYAERSGEYAETPAIKMFREYFPENYDFKSLEPKVFEK